MPSHETRGLTFGSYRGGEHLTMLTHTARITAPGEYTALCRISADALEMGEPCEGKDAPPTCPTCLRRDPRFAAPHRESGA